MVLASKERGIDLPQVQDFESFPGQGVAGVVEGRKVLIGNPALLEGSGVAIDSLLSVATRLAERGATPLWIAIDGTLAGIVAVADTIKPTSVEAIRRLHAEGLRMVMLTGDNEAYGTRHCTRGRCR